MNRVKLWVYVVLAVAAGALFLRSSSTDAVGRVRTAVDRRVTVAGEHAASALRALDAQAAAAAGLAAHDAAVQQALQAAAEPVPAPRVRGRRAPPPPPAPDEATRQTDRLGAARAAVAAAAARVGVPAAARVEVWIAAQAELAEGAKGDPAVWELLRGAASGKPRAGRIVLDDLAWTVAAAPTGDGGAIAVALPLDAAFAAAISSATGAAVTVAAPGAKTVSTARADDAALVTVAGARAPRALADAGRLAPIAIALPIPVKTPPVPLLFGAAPAHRVLAVPVDGLKGAQLVVSVATRPELVPLVEEQWLAAGALVVLLALGLLFGLLVRGEVAAQVPAELVSAAARLEKGEFGARAPSLAGKLGTIAAGLNRAAEAAERAAAAPTQPLFAAPPAPAEMEPSAFDLTARAAAAPAPSDPFASAASAPSPAASAPAAALFGGAFEATPIRAPAEPTPTPLPAAPAAAPADLLRSAAATAAPGEAAASDEDHWRQIFDDFLRVRRDCGEAAEGLTYDRFRAKLEKNRDQLVTKYGCRTVRFQVYVKDGKAALKATPVR